MYPDSENQSDESRPATPTEDDCCHNDCELCVFDVHKKLLQDYARRKLENIKVKKRSNVLSMTCYKPFWVRNIIETAENYVLLTMQAQGLVTTEYKKLKEIPITEDEAGKEGGNHVLLNPGQHVILNSWGVTRPYTPIAWSKKQITFLVKIYPNGRFTSHIRDLKIGEEIGIRGPYGEFRYTRNSFQQILMFSMGSGIAAHYPIAKAIVTDDLEDTRVHLIGGFQNILQIPLKKELQILSDYWNFKCTLHISHLASESKFIHGIAVKCGRLTEASASEIFQTTSAESTLILICGTEEFGQCVESWAGICGFKNIHIFR